MPAHSHSGFRASQLTAPLVLALFGLSVFVLFRHPDEVTDAQARLGSIGLCLSVLPSILFLNRIGSGPLPFMPAIGGFYLLAFVLPVFIIPEVPSIAVSTSISTKAILIVDLALLSLYAGFYAVRQMKRYTGILSVGVNHSVARLHAVLWTFIVLHLFELYVIRRGGLNSLSYVINSGCLVGYAYLFCKRISGEWKSGIGTFILGLCLALELAKRIASGLLAEPLELTMLAGFSYWIVKRRIPWVPVVAIALLTFKLQDAKVEYRNLTWFNGTLTDASSWEKLKNFVNLAYSEHHNTHTDKPLGGSFITRANQLGFLTEVTNQTPDPIPYWRGETYTILFYKLIPRLIWPDKPIERLGIDFSLRYGLRGISDDTTSINVPWIIELYANFGWTGIIAGMGVIGAGFAFLDREFNARRMPLLDRVVGLVILFDLVYQESNFSLMVGNKFLIYVSLALIFKFATQVTMRSRVMLEGRTGRTLPAYERHVYSRSSGC
jgi:hypothetical protein